MSACGWASDSAWRVNVDVAVGVLVAVTVQVAVGVLVRVAVGDAVRRGRRVGLGLGV